MKKYLIIITGLFIFGVADCYAVLRHPISWATVDSTTTWTGGAHVYGYFKVQTSTNPADWKINISNNGYIQTKSSITMCGNLYGVKKASMTDITATHYGDGSHLTGVSGSGGGAIFEKCFTIPGTLGIGNEQAFFICTTTGTIDSVIAFVNTAPTTAFSRYNVRHSTNNGTSFESIFTSSNTVVRIDQNEKSSKTTSEAYSFNSTYTPVHWGDIISVCVNKVGGGKDLSLTVRWK